MRSEADDTAKKECDAMLVVQPKRAQYFESREVPKHQLKDTVWPGRHQNELLSRQRPQ